MAPIGILTAIISTIRVSEDTASNPLQTWTSSRKELDEKFETCAFFAVLAVVIGYHMQFIGL